MSNHIKNLAAALSFIMSRDEINLHDPLSIIEKTVSNYNDAELHALNELDFIEGDILDIIEDELRSREERLAIQNGCKLLM
jgi:hypothetical protein